MANFEFYDGVIAHKPLFAWGSDRTATPDMLKQTGYLAVRRLSGGGVVFRHPREDMFALFIQDEGGADCIRMHGLAQLLEFLRRYGPALSLLSD